MLVLLSPTKQMDFTDHSKDIPCNGKPYYLNEAKLLNRELKKISRISLEHLMKISPKLSESTSSHIENFGNDEMIHKAALFAYSGTVYQSLKPIDFDDDDLDFASKHIRILSGLYGVLKPLDRISPYRLEMKTPLKNNDGENLYHFWKPRIASCLSDSEALQNEGSPIINLASMEYLKSVDKKSLKNPIISLQFKERNENGVKTVGMYSKVVRGLMARRIIRERITDPIDLQKGQTGGYVYDQNLSSLEEWIFVREN